MKPGAAVPARPAVPGPAPAPAPAQPVPAPHAGQALWLALDFPDLPLSALGEAAADAPPQAVSVHADGRPRLLAVDGAAGAAGVRVGMSVTAATALCPQLHVRRHDPAAEAAALQGLAAWALRYTPRVSLEPPHGLLLEIGASLRLFGGLGPLLEALRRDLRDLGHRVREGVAPTPGAAWLLALAGVREPVTVAAGLGGALSRVPVVCLDLPARAAQDLEALGLRTLGDCLRLPRDGLARRFGPRLLALLDRVLGRRADPRASWTPPPRFERRVDLAFESADRALLLAAAGRLLHELAGFLQARGCGAAALEIQLAHHGVPATRLVLELVTPCRDPGHLQALLAERLERVPIEHEVLYVGLRVRRLVALQPAARDLYARGDATAAGPAQDGGVRRAELLVERLGARLGHGAVCALVRVADHRPERASGEAPWHAGMQGASTPSKIAGPRRRAAGAGQGLLLQSLCIPAIHGSQMHRHSSSTQVLDEWSKPETASSAQRVGIRQDVEFQQPAMNRAAVPPGAGMPLWLLPEPRPLDTAGGAAVLDGRLDLEHGPQRIESGWWDGGDVARDYYVALSARGTRYWIFRERRAPGRWFVHGLFA